MAFEEAYAGVPSQDCVVVASGAQVFCLPKELQRFDDPVMNIAAGAGSVGVEVGFGAALPCDAGIVGAIVLGFEVGDGGNGAVEGGGFLGDLVGEREYEADARLAIGGIDGEDVVADAFSFVGLVEQAIAFGFGEGGFDAVVRDGLEVEHRIVLLLVTGCGRAASGDRSSGPRPAL